MPGTYSKVKTVTPGDDITAADRNAEHDNHINNADPDGIGDASANTTEMQATADPYPGDSESLSTDLRGELQRIRYQILTQLGLTQWYHDLTTSVKSFYEAVCFYRRPRLIYVSATQVDVENNTGTSNETQIIFPDGNVRSVTEDTSSAHKHRRFDITATAEFTSGTEDSGLRSGVSETNDNWYALYAVKSAIDTSKFVLVGDTTAPNSAANIATLNSNLGSNAWVYLGMIRNGGNGQNTAAGDIIPFIQQGNETMFQGATGGKGGLGMGLVVGDTAANPALYTISGGFGTAQIPDHFDIVDLYARIAAGTAGNGALRAENATRIQHEVSDSDGVSTTVDWGATMRVAIDDSEVTRFAIAAPSSGASKSIILIGWIDPALRFL